MHDTQTEKNMQQKMSKQYLSWNKKIDEASNQKGKGKKI